jgi:sugar lactone lactonase YvrE
MTDVRLASPVGTLLGEGPLWFPDEQALRFVDIKAGRLHRFVPASRECTTVELGGAPSFVVGDAGGGVLVGSEHGIYRLDGMRLGACVQTIDQPAHNRTNDATVDSLGRLWFGTMDDHESMPTGTLWCLDRGRLLHMGGEAIVTNGPALSADSKTLFVVDSTARVIWRHPVGDGPVLGEGDLFLRLTEADGYPDGIVLDSEDCLWVALWDGWGVRRYAPDGTLLLHVKMPCARITKIAFGGPELHTAYVTSARVGLSEDESLAQPLAGGLFEFDAPAPGLIVPPARV